MPVRTIRRRYLKFRVDSHDSVREQDVYDAIVNSVSSLYGIKGLSEAALRLIEYEGNEGIIRCSHLQLRKVRSAIALISHLDGKVAVVHTLKAAGTLKSLRGK